MADVYNDVDGAPAAAAAEEEMPVLVPVPMDMLDWDRYVEEVPIEDPDFCFWCQYAQTQDHYTNNKNVEKLRKYHEENFNRVHPFEFAREMQRLYRLYLQECLKNHQGQVCLGPEWSGRSIYEHTTVHTVEARDVFEEWCRTLVRAVQVMRDTSLFLGDRANPGKILGLDVKVLGMYIKTIKEAKPFLEKLGASRKSALYSIS